MKRLATHSVKRRTVPVAAAAVAGIMLPLGVSAPGSAVSPADDKPAFSGYSAESWATPLQMEIFEPTIPIPAEPQAEIEYGYSMVKADSTSSRGRASYLWPGAPVGEGFKTIIEGVGLPSALGESGYPAQVNSTQPGGPDFESNEPLPGSVMRTGAGIEKTYAETSFSPDNEAQDSGEDSDGDDAGGGSGIPGLPGLPGLPAAFGGGSSDGASANAAGPGIPPELAALVDFGGYTSVSKTTYNPNLAFSTSRASISDVTLLGGVITIDGVKVKATTKSDGKKGEAFGSVEFGTLNVAGQKFTMGDNGFEAAGQAAPIPGLPDEAAKALKRLGVTLSVPKPVYTKDGAAATAAVDGLVVEIDARVLKGELSGLPLDQIIGILPDEAGELKSLLQAAANLSTRYVLTLGTANAAVETVQPVELPPVETPDPEPTEEPADDAAAGGGGGSAGSVGGSSAAPSSGGIPTDTGAVSDAPADLVDAAPASSAAGLPPLFSIPGALLFGGLLGAALFGSYFRRLGILALGAGSSCPHGLDSGLPDLRKA